MKYIKLFESSDELYFKIKMDDYYYLCRDGNRELWTEVEKKKIYDFITMTNNKLSISIDNDPTLIRIYYNSGGYKNQDKGFIIKIKDDWFCVFLTGVGTKLGLWVFYKCDEMDGLLEFLRKEGELWTK